MFFPKVHHDEQRAPYASPVLPFFGSLASKLSRKRHAAIPAGSCARHVQSSQTNVDRNSSIYSSMTSYRFMRVSWPGRKLHVDAELEAWGEEMGQTSSQDSVDRWTPDVARYVRWRMLDSKHQNGQWVWCWLDRETGRLVHQPAETDPNVAVEPAGSHHTFVR